MKAHQALAVVTLTVLLAGSALAGASGAEPVAPQPQPQQSTPPQQDSKADADATRKAVRARMARCKIHPEICRQQPPK
jgi:hypothetical protein